MPRAPAMPACLAPRRCPHASRPGDARMPRAPAMPACLAPRRCPHASRPGDARMPLTLAMTDVLLIPAMTDVLLIPAMTDDTSPRHAEGSSLHYVTSKSNIGGISQLLSSVSSPSNISMNITPSDIGHSPFSHLFFTIGQSSAKPFSLLS
ncbi:hypothetical protein VNO80_03371 [Phaseolus coccineus]